MRVRSLLLIGSAVPLLLLGACGGGSGGVASTPPAPPSAGPPPAPPPPPPPPSAVYDTPEYQRSNAAVQAQALSAYVAGATGAGVIAAVIDSGVDATSTEFSGKLSPLSADLAGSRGIQDQGGHGTAVSGVLLAAKNDNGIHGVALGATLLVARTDNPGTCSAAGCAHDDNNIAKGVDLARTAGARVINMSLGGSPPNATLRTAIDRATTAGIIIVISAGNEGVSNPTNAQNPDLLAQVANDPIAHGLVLIAGATDSNKVLADFSNKAGNGALHYLTALGVSVRANDETGKAFLWTGTSFSAPVVSGAVALLAQAFPNLTGAQIVDLLLRTATDLGVGGTDAVYGRGEVNIARAFAPQGQTSLGGSNVAVSLTDNGSLSSPMGDAGQSGMATIVRDAYGRDFDVDLASTFARAPQSFQLLPALSHRSRQLNARGQTTTLALSVADHAPERLLLTQADYGSARALAGSVATRIGRDTSLALGFATGSESLDRNLSAQSSPAFLVDEGRRGVERAPRGAFALRRQLGPVGMSLAAESGDVQIWQRSALGPRGDRYRRYGYGAVTWGADGAVGPLALDGRITRMSERETVLGARFLSALGGEGATSWFADGRVTLVPAVNWQLRADYRHGRTLIPAGSARMGSALTTRALAIDVARTSLLTVGDSFALRWSEPLRVTSGGIALIGLDPISLTPSGHERDVEAVYARALGPGWMTLNSYWRQEPGNYASAPDDIGVAARLTFGF